MTLVLYALVLAERDQGGRQCCRRRAREIVRTRLIATSPNTPATTYTSSLETCTTPASGASFVALAGDFWGGLPVRVQSQSGRYTKDRCQRRRPFGSDDAVVVRTGPDDVMA